MIGTRIDYLLLYDEVELRVTRDPGMTVASGWPRGCSSSVCIFLSLYIYIYIYGHDLDGHVPLRSRD